MKLMMAKIPAFKLPPFDPRAAGPMEQFEIHRMFHLPFGDLDVSFTNSTLWMWIAVSVAILFFAFATRSRAMIPNRMQSVAELIYDFVADMVRGAIGPEGMKFFPYVFTLFIYILLANLLGLFPSVPGLYHTFTTTSPHRRHFWSRAAVDYNRHRLRLHEKWSRLFKTVCPVRRAAMAVAAYRID